MSFDPTSNSRKKRPSTALELDPSGRTSVPGVVESTPTSGRWKSPPTAGQPSEGDLRKMRQRKVSDVRSPTGTPGAFTGHDRQASKASLAKTPSPTPESFHAGMLTRAFNAAQDPTTPQKSAETVADTKETIDHTPLPEPNSESRIERQPREGDSAFQNIFVMLRTHELPVWWLSEMKARPCDKSDGEEDNFEPTPKTTTSAGSASTSQKQKAEVADPNKGRCMISGQSRAVAGLVQTAHIMPNMLWYNLYFFAQTGMFFLTKEPGSLVDLRETFKKKKTFEYFAVFCLSQDRVQKLDEDLGPMVRRDAEGRWKMHSFPYTDLPVIKSHAQPQRLPLGKITLRVT
ncbi:hypothetical protein CONPUDRAFT_154261 [Coniophora puteana RWD-64-598 SS2]|uniref:Uncharacterized protein n=1 Tax=Coniophora puteana (strain RWD-64-598) TaxID=741705 RepID=A0A5M3MNB4_CONPW|nr:uncharacterized protein CONPUDRAFT_154261 [Coniophora puteana RWD-64-598 SS2]EIW80215.1 hypothetical protein CONPUDRAFT_154261 [Coniophora puteana RWD-64-598 SS2]